MTVIRTTHGCMHHPIQKVMHSLRGEFDLISTHVGGFSHGFSAGFDIIGPSRRAFTNGFSVGFASFEFRKAFSQGFSTGFAKENR